MAREASMEDMDEVIAVQSFGALLTKMAALWNVESMKPVDCYCPVPRPSMKPTDG